MNRTQIYFPPHQLEELRRLARERNTTVSEVIRDLLNKGLESEKRPGEKPKKFKSLLSTAQEIRAISRQGSRDLAADLDQYLYE